MKVNINSQPIKTTDLNRWYPKSPVSTTLPQKWLDVNRNISCTVMQNTVYLLYLFIINNCIKYTSRHKCVCIELLQVQQLVFVVFFHSHPLKEFLYPADEEKCIEEQKTESNKEVETREAQEVRKTPIEIIHSETASDISTFIPSYTEGPPSQSAAPLTGFLNQL